VLAITGALVWRFWENLYGFFGWGLLFIAAAIITVIVQAKRRKLSSFILRLNRWLGAAAFVLAAWGILAIFDLGGKFGAALIMEPAPVVDILIVTGLVTVGVVMVAPRACLRLATKFFSWLRGQLQRRPEKVPKYLEKQLEEERVAIPPHVALHPRPPIEEKPAIPREMARPVVRPEKVIP